jgi:hypothetical protein
VDELKKLSKTVSISVSGKGTSRPRIEVEVPFGTTLADTFRLHDFLSKELISKLSPRGCLACNSGVDIFIHERFKDVINVNLETLEIQR